MSTIEVISQEQYLATIPLIIHRYIINELQFQLQTIIDEKHLVYYRHTKTMAIFIQPDIEIPQDIPLFMAKINLSVMQTLNTFRIYDDYHEVLENNICLLTAFIQSDDFTEVQKQKFENLM